MSYNERIAHLNDCLSAKSRDIQRANFVRLAAFASPSDACLWAEEGNAHAPFSAFCHDGRSILVQPNADGGYWFWTEDRCPVSSRPVPYHARAHEAYGGVDSIRQDIYSGNFPEFVIPDTRPEVDTLPGRAFVL